MARQFVFFLFNIWKFDAVFIWFADLHSFLPVLFAKVLKKKSIVVIGGYDVARIPEQNYGVFSNRLRGFCAIFSMNNCSLNLTVSSFVDRKVKWIAKKSTRKLLYNCVNLPVSGSSEKKKDLILTVGLIDSERTYYLKGIDTFVGLAALLPQYKFVIVGAEKRVKDALLGNSPANLHVAEPVNHGALNDYYKEAKIYCQLSRSESFGVAIVEAMNQGCFPLVTNVGGMPEIVKGYGIVVKRDLSEISGTIEKVIQNNTPVSSDLFKVALKPFLFEARKKRLLGVVNQLIKIE
ncbi:glycosyltransferase family 4 protein [Mariniphaga anaerophila]|nr:glycosyltransferase family 4 protein [Mariniphaga anaerophila]